VTPENNAAVRFLKAIGPGRVPASMWTRYFQLLGIAPLPEVSRAEAFDLGGFLQLAEANMIATARDPRKRSGLV
jgi:hypothetical protein